MNRDPNEPDALERMIAGNDDSLPPELEARLRVHLDRLHARIDAASDPSAAIKESWIMSLVRNLKTGRARWATAAALAIVAIVLSYMFIGGGPGMASYAAVVERLKTARTFSYSEKSVAPQSPTMNWTTKVYFAEPGLMRLESRSAQTQQIGIFDFQKGSAISLMPATKQYMLASMKDLPTGNYMNQFEELRKLPATADEAMFGELDGRRVRIYLAEGQNIRKILWLDDATGQLVHYVMEYPKDKGGLRFEMSDFQFDPPLDPGMFSLEPPAGYQPLSAPITVGPPTEEMFQKFMRTYTDLTGEFPSILDPARPAETSEAMQDAMMLLQTKSSKSVQDAMMHLLTKPRESLGGNAEESLQAATKNAVQFATQFATGFSFIMMLQPENDFHYAGAGVKPGNPGDWIAWWKPTGSATYRVIRGDLTLTDATADEVAAHAPAK